MKKNLNYFMNKYRFSPETLSRLTGYSVDSINSQLSGRRNVQDRLLLFLELYEQHEESKLKFNAELEKIDYKYKKLIGAFDNKLQKLMNEFETASREIISSNQK